MNIPVPLIGLLVGLLITGVLVLSRPKSPPRGDDESDDREPVPANVRDDPRYWLAGFIYNNPDDPSMLVPKRYGAGFTFNFGHPLGRVLLIATILLPILLVILKSHAK